MKKLKPEILKEAENIILQDEWKGNVRELRNICERLIVLDTTGKVSKKDIINVLPSYDTSYKAPKVNKVENDGCSLTSSIKNFERDTIMNALKEAKYNKKEAVKLLNISYSTLWRRMCDLGIE